MPKLKNILIFGAILVVLVLAYIFFVKSPSSSDQASLVSSSGTTNSPGTDAGTTNSTSLVAGNFLSLLLSVKTIQLNTDIFSDPAFASLHDSSIVLVPDATTGRPNPFAQFGAENVVVPTTTPSISTPASNTNIALPNTSNNEQSAPAPTQSLKLN